MMSDGINMIRELVRLMHEVRVVPPRRLGPNDFAVALEEFIGLLPPNIMIDPEESQDVESITLTFNPPRALSFGHKGGDMPYSTARKALRDEIVSIIVDELGHRKAKGTNSSFVRSGIKVIVLDHTHGRDRRRDRDDDRSIPSFSVEFYGA